MTDDDLIRRGDVRKAVHQLFVDAFAGRLNDDPAPNGIIDRIPAATPRPMKDAPRDGWQPIGTWDRKINWVVLYQPKDTAGRLPLNARAVLPGQEGRRVSTHWMRLPHPPEGGSDA